MSEYVVAAIQTIPVRGDVARSVEDHVRLARHAARNGARLAVFPELSLTGYDRGLKASDEIPANDPRVEPLRRLSEAEGIAIIVGAPVRGPAGLCIAALCFVPNREPLTHTKRHLHEGEERAFTAGDGGPPLQIAGVSVGIAICADITHPEHAESAASQGARLYAASCFITPQGHPHDCRLLERYARDHRMAVAMANYGSACAGWKSAGASAIWSSSGALLARAPDSGEAVITASPLSNP